MRIAVLANPASPHTRRWAAALSDRGHDVHVVGIRDAAIPGVTVHTVRVPFWPRPLAALLSYVRLLASVRRRMRRIDPEVVNAHYSVTHGTIATLARLHPVVVTVWGSDLVKGDQVVGGPKRWLNRMVLGRADAVTCASRFLVSAIRKVAGGLVRVDEIPFGVDTAVFSESPAPDRPRIGFVKHLRRRYGPDLALRAMARVVERHPTVEMVMAGSGPDRRRLERLAAQLDIAERVRFPGAVAHEAVPDLLRSLTLLVNPSRSESFGVVILEASACCRPVVATRIGGASETVVDGETGILVSPDDPAALADAIDDLLDDERRRVAMGRAGREHVRARYEWAACVTAMERVLTEVAA